MYQIFTYLMHQPMEMDVRGILIYPFNEVEVDEAFWWDERVSMEVLSVNLDEYWKIFIRG
jgi:5-methylcytosine-specific restriction enzyme subunit McrC